MEVWRQYQKKNIPSICDILQLNNKTWKPHSYPIENMTFHKLQAAVVCGNNICFLCVAIKYHTKKLCELPAITLKCSNNGIQQARKTFLVIFF